MTDIFNSANKKDTRDEKTLGRSEKNAKKGDSKKTDGIKSLLESPKRHNLPGHSHNPLSSYSYLPDYVKFVNEDPEEKVILVLRSHPITNFGWMLTSFFMIIVPSFIIVLTP